jgi:hypothetical protein
MINNPRYGPFNMYTVLHLYCLLVHFYFFNSFGFPLLLSINKEQYKAQQEAYTTAFPMYGKGVWKGERSGGMEGEGGFEA